MAKNKELNAWASMKKVTQIRQDHVERNDQAIFERKARNEAIKRKILQSLYELWVIYIIILLLFHFNPSF